MLLEFVSALLLLAAGREVEARLRRVSAARYDEREPRRRPIQALDDRRAAARQFDDRKRAE